MEHPTESQARNGSPGSSTGTRGTLGRWVVVGMLVVWVAAILSRNVIRAHWWARGLAVSTSPNDRLGYFYRLASLGDTAVPAVSSLLESDDPSLRSFAVGVLHHAPGDRAFTRLVQAAQDADLDVARLAIRGLAMRLDERSARALAAIAAASPAGQTRRAMMAAAALADAGTETATRHLLNLLRSAADAGVKVEVIQGVATLRAGEAIEPLLDLLEDEAVFEGVTERDMMAARALNSAMTDYAGSGASGPTPTLRIEDRHVVWQVAAHALRSITGHRVEEAQADRLDQNETARRWRRWWRETSRERPDSPP